MSAPETPPAPDAPRTLPLEFLALFLLGIASPVIAGFVTSRVIRGLAWVMDSGLGLGRVPIEGLWPLFVATVFALEGWWLARFRGVRAARIAFWGALAGYMVPALAASRGTLRFVEEDAAFFGTCVLCLFVGMVAGALIGRARPRRP